MRFYATTLSLCNWSDSGTAHEFEVPAEDLFERSYEQRRDELHAAPTELPILAKLYGLNPNVEPNAVVADILSFEFSSRFNTAEQHP